jgi:hypothetical protein
MIEIFNDKPAMQNEAERDSYIAVPFTECAHFNKSYNKVKRNW